MTSLQSLSPFFVDPLILRLNSTRTCDDKIYGIYSHLYYFYSYVFMLLFFTQIRPSLLYAHMNSPHLALTSSPHFMLNYMITYRL